MMKKEDEMEDINLNNRFEKLACKNSPFLHILLFNNFEVKRIMEESLKS